MFLCPAIAVYLSCPAGPVLAPFQPAILEIVAAMADAPSQASSLLDCLLLFCTGWQPCSKPTLVEVVAAMADAPSQATSAFAQISVSRPPRVLLHL
jgi:cytochrome c biogenesis protein CcdA